MKMGGFVGEAEYRAEMAAFVPLLKLGEKVHVGKATGFGLGRYTLQQRAGRASD
jgi:CRISPR/Cas system endoribonuclease Cas6 (RAMP superfamily)